MSYLDHYNLKEEPFSTSVDNRFYYNSTQHAEALVRLKYAAEQRKGLALLVGDVGAGKTTLARRLLDELDESSYESALLIVIHSSITSEWLLRKISVQLGVEKPAEGKTDLLGQLYNRLAEIHDKKKRAVVLIDEAQMLQTKEVMEEFRGILNIELDGHKLITFILFGLPEVDQHLALDEPLRQRVAIRYHLQAFTEGSSEDYMKYRLQIAGCKKDLFTKSAYSAVHQFAKGIPRLINTLCDNALLEGYLRKKDRIDHDMIREIAVDLKLVNK
ncbi:MAG TPA: AAA family ATPase [Nitrospiria bacterium]|nr:AAA family ATPase [Nitrospiria bacterium]HUK56484.1 AAA family ATPase [Nitrospiria bacterium]